MAKHVVRFATKLEGVNVTDWKPNEGDKYEVSKVVALSRAEVLWREGVAGACVDGVVPYLIEIFQLSKDAPALLMLSITTEPKDEPCGPWANLFIGGPETEMA